MSMRYGPRTLAALARAGILPEAVAGRGLREYEEASELEPVETGADGRVYLLAPHAAQAWRALSAAAAADGVRLYIVSAFRSVDRQLELIERKLARGDALSDILSVIAPPGFSEHHTGRAVDVGCPEAAPLEREFDRTPAFRWLRSRAGEFGFLLSYPEGNPQGYQYEPWHWCHRVGS
ncbi:MAG: M15 family metallopeptidase [Gammaproteobacteria bacterium]|nr:M15 family metallopeptidase [Gammaproteobacteria bacterium]